MAAAARRRTRALQNFVTRNLSKGWYLNMAPIISTNWEADNGDRTIVPLGGGFGQIFKMGPQAVNASVGAYVNVKRPDHLPSPTWQLRRQMVLLYPQK